MTEEERIERYLAGQMDRDEAQQFQDELKQNAALRDSLELQQEAMVALRLAGAAEKREGIAKTLHEVPQQKPRAARTFTWLAIAASVLIIAVVGVFLMRPESQPQERYAEYFEPYRAPVNVRSGEQEQHWQQATEAYAAGNYTNASSAYKELLQTGAEPQYLVHFYLGMSILAAEGGNPKEAISHFDAVQKSPNDYHQQAQWYRALALLKAGETEKAKRELEEISGSHHYKAVEAGELLEELQ